MKHPEKTAKKKSENTQTLAVDMGFVDELLIDILPTWVSGSLEGCYNATLNVIHCGTAEEHYKLMYTFPEEVIAYNIFHLSRSTKFFDTLFDGSQKEIKEMLDTLKRIRDRRDSDDDDDQTEIKQCSLH